MRVNLTSVMDLLFIMLFIFMADSHEAAVENQKKKDTLVIRVRNLEIEIASASRVIDEKSRALEEKENQWRIVVLQKDEISSKAADLASDVRELETDKILLTKNLASAQATIEKDEKELNGLASKAAGLANHVRDLEKANSELEESLASAQATIEEKGKELNEVGSKAAVLEDHVKSLQDANSELRDSLATAQAQIDARGKELQGAMDNLNGVAEGIKKAIGNLDEETLKKLLSGFSVKDEESAKTVIKAMANSNSRNLVESLALFSKMTAIFLPLRIHLNRGQLRINLMGSSNGSKSIPIPSGLREAFSTPSEWESAKQGFVTQLKSEYKTVGSEREKQIIMFSFAEAKEYERLFVVETMNFMQQKNPDSVIFVNSGYYKMEGNP